MKKCLAIALVALFAACESKPETGEATPVPEKVAEPTAVTSVQPAPKKAEAKPVERKLAVQGMTCKGCAASVRQALLSVEGVHEANVNFEKGEAVIKCDGTVTGATLIQRVENYEVGGVKQSYKAQDVTDVKPSPTTGASSVEHELAIQGMCCTGCAAGVRKALMAVEGVKQADVSFANGKAVVKSDGSVAAATLVNNLKQGHGVPGKRRYKVQDVTP